MMNAEDITIEDLDKGTKTFRLVFWMTEGGGITVNANSKREAEKKLDDYLSMYSNDDALQKRFDCSNREWEVMEFETVELKK